MLLLITGDRAPIGEDTVELTEAIAERAAAAIPRADADRS